MTAFHQAWRTISPTPSVSTIPCVAQGATLLMVRKLVWLKFGLVEDDEHSYLVWGVRPSHPPGRDRLLFQMALNHEQLEWVPRSAAMVYCRLDDCS